MDYSIYSIGFEIWYASTPLLFVLFNSIVYVGLYGYDYWEASSKVYQLFQVSGWSVILNGHLVSQWTLCTIKNVYIDYYFNVNLQS